MLFINQRANVAKKGYLAVSVLLIILGVLIAVNPELSAILICRVLGVCLLLFGLFKIVGYFSNDLYRLAFQFDLTLGILMLISGVVLIIRSTEVLHITCIVVGFFVLVDALPKIQIAVDAKRFGIRKWWLILAVAIITAVIGVSVIIRPYESVNLVMILVGFGLITEGILNLTTILTAVEIRERRFSE